MFDSQGRRIAEYDEATGTLLREYIWNGWEPVALIEGGVVYYVRADHIGRPVFATKSSGVKVWEVSYLPFGGVHTSTGNLPAARFPGQWFQSESGLHQNWMRDYDPTTGRYLVPDPLGLVDGASVYGYVKGNPMRFVDPTGQFIPVLLLIAADRLGGCILGALAGAAGYMGGLFVGMPASHLSWDRPLPPTEEIGRDCWQVTKSSCVAGSLTGVLDALGILAGEGAVGFATGIGAI